MSTKKSKYDKLEDKFIEIAQEILDNYNVTRPELVDILFDRTTKVTNWWKHTIIVKTMEVGH